MDSAADTLMFAAQMHNVALTRKLLERGADVKAQDSHGKTVFGWAKYSPELLGILQHAATKP